MAVLSNTDRFNIWAGQMRQWSARKELLGVLTKAELRAAVDAIDTWVDTNTASYNSAIPQPARTVLTAKQKAELLTLIITRRYEVS